MSFATCLALQELSIVRVEAHRDRAMGLPSGYCSSSDLGAQNAQVRATVAYSERGRGQSHWNDLLKGKHALANGLLGFVSLQMTLEAIVNAKMRRRCTEEPRMAMNRVFGL